jgi:APA family basic amino acid/polyamine antiporter
LILGTLALLTFTINNKLGNSYVAELLNGDFKNYTEDAMMKDKLFFTTDIAKLSTIIFWISALLLSVAAFIKKYSLMPLMGLITCLYLLTGMTTSNWLWFIGWLAIGLVIYFMYGYKKSKLVVENN